MVTGELVTVYLMDGSACAARRHHEKEGVYVVVAQGMTRAEAEKWVSDANLLEGRKGGSADMLRACVSRSLDG